MLFVLPVMMVSMAGMMFFLLEGLSSGDPLDRFDEGKLLRNHRINHIPVRQPTEIAIVDEEVRGQLARLGGICPVLPGLVAVDSIELDSPLLAEKDGIIKELSFPYSPENQFMAVLGKAVESQERTRLLLSYLRKTMLDYRTVEVNCNHHTTEELRSGFSICPGLIVCSLTVAITVAVAISVTIAITVAVTIAVAITICTTEL